KGFDEIRKAFAKLSEARRRGYGPGHFSFNVAGGRCETCEGAGYQRLEMYFFEDLYVTCEDCQGKRYKREILEITYQGKNIGDVLSMTVEEALRFFPPIPGLQARLKVLSDVGLGYLRLGQPATTLSGGEAQRLKIAAELGARLSRDYLYILDEPTTGLHFEDIKRLLAVLDRLVEAGNTVVVVEHNLDVIKMADHIIDLGPEGGDRGGEIIAQGPPEEIIEVERSYTGRFLKNYISPSP
ncbi:MAG: excinuclease ABC subunit UvrA, partial [candidate division NC10 bacterium]|nr:excinuclease ABC subunit UvrA [candidate division NC10 bacterium]